MIGWVYKLNAWGDEPMIDIAVIRQHARQNYNVGGWDVLVECWEDKDIVEFCQKANIQDTQAAIFAIGQGLEIYDDYRQDIQAEIF